MMTCGVSFLASLANRVSVEHCTQGTPLLLAGHHPQLLVIALVALLKWWRRPRPGLCPTCRYNLTGNTSGVCPECGTKIQTPAPAKTG
jgi:hypothetical protein